LLDAPALDSTASTASTISAKSDASLSLEEARAPEIFAQGSAATKHAGKIV
jgi:hypothetical protein